MTLMDYQTNLVRQLNDENRGLFDTHRCYKRGGRKYNADNRKNEKTTEHVGEHHLRTTRRGSRLR